MDRQIITKPQAMKASIDQPITNELNRKQYFQSDSCISLFDEARGFVRDFSSIPVKLKSPTGSIQPKLIVGGSNDKFEEEANGVAAQVVGMSESKVALMSNVKACSSSSVIRNSIQRVCASSFLGENLVQRKPTATGGKELNSSISSRIRSIFGGGRSMSPAERNFFEPRFRSDFSNVRIHDNTHANKLASSISARAFTLGKNVVFGAGEYSSDSKSGRMLLAHELAHVNQQEENSRVVQRHATRQARLNSVCYNNPRREPTPNAKHPEQHPTYEQWLASFSGLAEFRADDTFHPSNPDAEDHVGPRFRVLGRQGRQFGDTAVRDIANHTPDEDHEHGEETLPVPVSGNTRNGEEYIDHPTNQWVLNCLPENLRATAFQLPSDCADIAVILRHVWLAAHNRTESYGRWTVGAGVRSRVREIVSGDNAGSANQRRVRGLITDVYSGNAHHIISGYANERGRGLTDFDQIKNLLHPGDILAWEHKEVISARSGRVRVRRTGGHVQTISEISRSGNNITAIRVLQGNQPIFKSGAEEIMRSRGIRNPDGDSEEGRRLRDLPSRRIERSNAISIENIRDPVTGSTIWGEIDSNNSDGSIREFTTIVSAGPPRAARRPAMRGRSRTRVRRISDWFSILRSVSLESLYGTLEAALLEARSIIDSGNVVSNTDADTLGKNAGENIWSSATRSGGTGGATHFEPLHNMRAMIRALGGIQPKVYRGNQNAEDNVRRTFLRIDSEFNFSARGGSSIAFNRRVRTRGEVVKVLVTGFDPFSTNPPPRGDWNPAGATALALDNKQVELGNRNIAAVESFIYPVSFAQFNRGIVERAVRSANADAVLTVSLLPRLANGSPVQIEQFTVGMHRLTALQTHRLFPSEPANPSDSSVTIERRGLTGRNAIFESQLDLRSIAADTEHRDRNNQLITPRPTIASGITFRFDHSRTAQRFLNALGLQQTANSTDVLVSDPAAIQNIISNSVRVSDRHGLTANISVTLDNTRFRATILEGPGGSFLSNEVAYRTQGELLRQNSSAVSFHTHVPNVDPGAQNIPENGTRSQRQSARSSINRLVSTMKRLIRAVGIRILGQRSRGTGSNDSSDP